MRTLLALLAISLPACTTGAIVIAEDGSAIEPTPEPEPEPDPVSPFAGEWSATLVLLADFGRGPTELCVADLELEIDDEGALATDGFCQLTFGGGQGRSGYEVDLAGAVDEDGVLDVRSVWVPVGPGVAPIDDVPLTGAATDSDGEATGATVINIGFPLDAEIGLSIGR